MDNETIRQRGQDDTTPPTSITATKSQEPEAETQNDLFQAEMPPTVTQEKVNLAEQTGKLTKGAGEWFKKHEKGLKVLGALGLAAFITLDWPAILPLVMKIGSMPIISSVVGYLKGLGPGIKTGFNNIVGTAKNFITPPK